MIPEQTAAHTPLVALSTDIEALVCYAWDAGGQLGCLMRGGGDAVGGGQGGGGRSHRQDVLLQFRQIWVHVGSSGEGHELLATCVEWGQWLEYGIESRSGKLGWA